MDTLANTLFTAISQSMEEFSQVIAENSNLSKEEFLNLWNSRASPELKVAPKAEKKASKPRAKADSSAATCEYIFTAKSKNPGSKCPSKAKEGSQFCGKHSKGNATEKKTVEKKPAAKAKKASEVKETAAVKKLSEGKSHLAIKRNEHGNFEHPETRFVFDRASKEVYGKQGDTKVEDLTAEDIDLCRQHGFKFRLPANLTSEDNEPEDEESKEDEQSENDEDEELEEDDEEEDDDN